MLLLSVNNLLDLRIHLNSNIEPIKFTSRGRQFAVFEIDIVFFIKIYFIAIRNCNIFELLLIQLALLLFY